MKKLNFKQLEKISAGAEVSQIANFQQIDDSLTKNQKCLLYGLGFTGGIISGFFGFSGGFAIAAGGAYAAITNC
jgi:uncharacterized membrane protein YfcA